jgi:hypothetical protein
MVQDWAREDDMVSHQLRALELKRTQVSAMVRGRLYSTLRSYGDTIEIQLVLENTGETGFTVNSATFEMRVPFDLDEVSWRSFQHEPCPAFG